MNSLTPSSISSELIGNGIVPKTHWMGGNKKAPQRVLGAYQQELMLDLRRVGIRRSLSKLPLHNLEHGQNSDIGRLGRLRR